MLFSQFVSKIYCMVLLTHLQLMGNSSTCTDKWRPIASTLCPLSVPHKNAGGMSQLCLKQTSNGSSPENFLSVGGYFECYMYHVTCSARLDEERTILVSTVSGLPLCNDITV